MFISLGRRFVETWARRNQYSMAAGQSRNEGCATRGTPASAMQVKERLTGTRFEVADYARTGFNLSWRQVRHI
jgi:hypothetical protein